MVAEHGVEGIVERGDSPDPAAKMPMQIYSGTTDRP